MKDAFRIRNEYFVAAIHFVTAGAVGMEYCYCTLAFILIPEWQHHIPRKNRISIIPAAFDRNEMRTRTDRSLNSHHYVSV